VVLYSLVNIYFSVYKCIFFGEISSLLTCGVVSLFIFLEKTKQKSVVALESLRFQGRSPQQRKINNTWLSPDASNNFTLNCLGETNAYRNSIKNKTLFNTPAVCAFFFFGYFFLFLRIAKKKKVIERNNATRQSKR